MKDRIHLSMNEISTIDQPYMIKMETKITFCEVRYFVIHILRFGSCAIHPGGLNAMPYR